MTRLAIEASAVYRAAMLGFFDRLTTDRGTIGRVLLILMAIGFGSLLVAGIAAARVTVRNQQYTAWVNHTYEVELSIASVRRLIEQAETARRGYILTADRSYRAIYVDAERQLGGAIARLAKLTADNPRQRAALAVIRPQLAKLVAARQRSVVLISQDQAAAAGESFKVETATKPMQSIRQILGRMSAEEQRLLMIRDADRRASVRAFYTVLVAAGLLLFSVAVVSLLAVLRYTRDLAEARDRLGTLNDTLEEQVAERTADLSRANEEIQRFAYIVSHDLRSPLVNVMGFTAELAAAAEPLSQLIERTEQHAPEILTEEARLAVREDLPEAIGFIRTSTQKMDRLINAILRLSREGRRVVTPEPIDLVALTDSAVAAMQQVIDERGAAVAVMRTMPSLVSDRLAVEQILSNLIENATKYLQPSRPGQITVSAAEARGRVVIAVADNGRGIAPGDHERIFDLFRRAGVQDQPGEGIGLAHVRALAYRLAGTIEVTSTLGAGATFHVNLPATLESAQASV